MAGGISLREIQLWVGIDELGWCPGEEEEMGVENPLPYNIFYESVVSGITISSKSLETLCVTRWEHGPLNE